MSLLVKDTVLDGESTNIYVEDGTIKNIGSPPDRAEDASVRVLDGDDTLAVPTLKNGHTHAAMTLFRGFGDDMPLQEWLEDKIWPLEEKLTEEDVYWATRLACEEMIRTGTTFFNDMYWEFDGTVQAVEDSGIRAMVSGVFIDQFDEELAQTQRDQNRELFERIDELPDKVQFALGPHSIYTVSPESLEWIAEFSREHDLFTHIHLAETQHEVEECRETHGTTPVRYLDELGFLHDKVVAAHCLWLEDEEVEILAENDVSVVYNPISNLKLTSGDDFRYQDLKEAGVDVCLGTDGVASNNNFNLFEEIKMASILQKNRRNDATVLPANEAFELATARAAEIFGLNGGTLEEGNAADFMLIDLDNPSMSLATTHDEASHLSYTLTSDTIETVICDGEVLMQDGPPEGYEKLIEKFQELTRKLCY